MIRVITLWAVVVVTLAAGSARADKCGDAMEAAIAKKRGLMESCRLIDRDCTPKQIAEFVRDGGGWSIVLDCTAPGVEIDIMDVDD